MLTIVKLKRFSIDYYNETANQAEQAAMDGDTRTPTWLVAGDIQCLAETTGLTDAALHGGEADTETARIWLDQGRAPNGARGRAFSENSVHGFDLTFAAPKSVSLIRVLTDDVTEKVLADAHVTAVEAAMTYLHQHAGHTRVHNGITGMKDLQRLPALVGIAYQHETSRCGDPHLHTHVIVPNRQPRADGQLAAVDSKSLFYQERAAGAIYRATLRHRLHLECAFEWQPVDPRTGMADIAGVPREAILAWSKRSTGLREWASDNLHVIDGQPTAAQLDVALKATRPPKPESLAWADLKQQWRRDERGLALDRDAHFAARAARRAAQPTAVDRARLAVVTAQMDKAVFTRADLVKAIAAQLPVDAPGEPRELIEHAVDAVGLRISAPRAAHEREGHERFTLAEVIAEEERIFDMVGARDNRARLDARPGDLAELSGDQRRATSAIADSPFLVQPVHAPAGMDKAHSLKSLRAAAHRARKQVLVLAPTGKAVDEAMADGAGDHGLSVAKALELVAEDRLALDRSMLVIVDEAATVATPELDTLLFAAVSRRAKVVLVGDAHRLSPFKTRGAMFGQLCSELPWSQDLSEVGRIHVGDPVAMAASALDAYVTDRANQNNAVLVCDTWEMADDRSTTAHAYAERTPVEHLPDVVAEALARNQHRRAVRQVGWSEHVKTVDAWREGYERMAAAAARSAEVSLDVGGLEV